MNWQPRLLPEFLRATREVTRVGEGPCMQVYVLFKVNFLRELLPASIALKPLYIEVKSIVVPFQRVLEEVRFATTWLLADKLVLRIALAFDLPG